MNKTNPYDFSNISLEQWMELFNNKYIVNFISFDKNSNKSISVNKYQYFFMHSPYSVLELKKDEQTHFFNQLTHLFSEKQPTYTTYERIIQQTKILETLIQNNMPVFLKNLSAFLDYPHKNKNDFYEAFISSVRKETHTDDINVEINWVNNFVQHLQTPEFKELQSTLIKIFNYKYTTTKKWQLDNIHLRLKPLFEQLKEKNTLTDTIDAKSNYLIKKL